MPNKNLETQKDAIIIILQALKPYRDMAEWFLEIIQTTNNIELETNLINAIYQKVKSIKSKKEIKNIKKNISETHNKYNYKEKQDRKDAEKLLDDFINNI